MDWGSQIFPWTSCGSCDGGRAEGSEVLRRKDLEALRLAPGTKRLLLNTRNSDFWSDPSHEFSPEFVALSPEGADWIANKGLFLRLIDYLSVEKSSEAGGETYQRLLEAGIVILEGINLREVDPGPYQLVCLPLKLAESDGAPARTILVRL